MQNSLRTLIANSSSYQTAFENARVSRKRVTTVYDVSTRCNLFCEGCLFFDRNGGFGGLSNGGKGQNYEGLFATEHQRGVTYPVFGGAEPSLEQDVLHQAASYWQNGMVHTNGIKKIHPELPYRLYTSVWGGKELTKKWRGADCYEKTLQNAQGDHRAIMNFTVNRENIDDIFSVAQDCHEMGLQMTFQAYSPTTDYLDYLDVGTGEEHLYIQSNEGDDGLVLRQEDLSRADTEVCRAIDHFPSTIVFTKALSKWLFACEETFPNLDTDQSIPAGCYAGNDPRHQHFQAGQILETHKTCGHPSIDCRTCKLYTTIYPAYFAEKLAIEMTEQDARDFLEAHHVFHCIFEGHRMPDKWRPLSA